MEKKEKRKKFCTIYINSFLKFGLFKRRRKHLAKISVIIKFIE
jgi:hypothetical protein